jgi:hypothetical protein
MKSNNRKDMYFYDSECPLEPLEPPDHANDPFLYNIVYSKVYLIVIGQVIEEVFRLELMIPLFNLIWNVPLFTNIGCYC